MYRLMDKIRQFMYGRYGNDHLNLALVLFGCIVTVAFSFSDIYALRLIGTVPYILALVRAMSKNTGKRRAENESFLRMTAPLRNAVTRKLNQSKDKNHRYFKCPSCKKVLRVPRGRGKIKITCPHCNREFLKKT